ncbi:MAG: transglycosylase SLT domain-containing protein [Bacteroidetes bacterium]|jgi:hypothetical protein|nr:transglycosylase SLT domain-containing protein [Bacteroidota bacterium]
MIGHDGRAAVLHPRAAPTVSEPDSTWVPDVPGGYVLDALRPTPPRIVPITHHGTSITVSYRAEQLLSDEATWRAMHWKDWDAVPQEIFTPAVRNQQNAYRHVLRPALWETMEAQDWDLVPGLVRAAAFLRMAEVAAARERLPIQHAGDWMKALAVLESFLDHRAVHRKDGNVDLGLYQHSAWARAWLSHHPDFYGLPDSAYFNPWISTRAAARLLKQNLIDTWMDVETGVLAYNTGLREAQKRSPETMRYRDLLYDRYVRYIQQPRSWPSWSAIRNMVEEGRILEGE